MRKSLNKNNGGKILGVASQINVKNFLGASRFLLVLLICLGLLLCGGCGEKESAAVQKEGSGYSVTDITGTRMEFAGKPQRIVSMSIGTDEILLDLVPMERILSVTYLADDGGISNIVERVKNIPNRTHGSSPESVLGLNPDLVLISDFFPPESYQTLRDMGMTVYVYKTPSNMKEIQNSILELAQVVGEPERGEQLVAEMNARVKKVQEKLAGIKEKRRVLFISAIGAYYSPEGTFRDTCRQAFVQDATEDLNYSQACNLSQEIIVKLNPDSFVIGDWNFDGEHSPEKLKQELLSNQSYMTIKAGKNKSVITIPSAHLLTCSQHFVLGVEDMAKAVYPEKFP